MFPWQSNAIAVATVLLFIAACATPGEDAPPEPQQGEEQATQQEDEQTAQQDEPTDSMMDEEQAAQMEEFFADMEEIDGNMRGQYGELEMQYTELHSEEEISDDLAREFEQLHADYTRVLETQEQFLEQHQMMMDRVSDNTSSTGAYQLVQTQQEDPMMDEEEGTPAEDDMPHDYRADEEDPQAQLDNMITDHRQLVTQHENMISLAEAEGQQDLAQSHEELAGLHRDMEELVREMVDSMDMQQQQQQDEPAAEAPTL